MQAKNEGLPRQFLAGSPLDAIAAQLPVWVITCAVASAAFAWVTASTRKITDWAIASFVTASRLVPLRLENDPPKPAMVPPTNPTPIAPKEVELDSVDAVARLPPPIIEVIDNLECNMWRSFRENFATPSAVLASCGLAQTYALRFRAAWVQCAWNCAQIKALD